MYDSGTGPVLVALLRVRGRTSRAVLRSTKGVAGNCSIRGRAFSHPSLLGRWHNAGELAHRVSQEPFMTFRCARAGLLFTAIVLLALATSPFAQTRAAPGGSPTPPQPRADIAAEEDGVP